MREEIRMFHFNSLDAFRSYMYRNLLFPHHVVSANAKVVDFNGEEDTFAKGYFAVKDKIRYFFIERLLNHLPVKITRTESRVENKDSVEFIMDCDKYNIQPQKSMSLRDMINTLACFRHSNSKHYILFWITCMASYISKTFTGVCTEPSFGKDSCKSIMHALTGKCYVMDSVRSIPGILSKITEDGEMVFNEVAGLDTQAKHIIEKMILTLGAGKTELINGAAVSRAHNTKEFYNAAMFSITAMYNRITDYDDVDSLFENQFTNKGAVKNRMLCFKFDGVVEEEFTKDFDPLSTGKQYHDFYLKLMRNLEFYKKSFRSELKPYTNPQFHTGLTPRQKESYNTILDFVNLYAKDEQEFEVLVKEFNMCIDEYRLMVESAKE